MSLLTRWSHGHDYARTLQKLPWRSRHLVTSYSSRTFSVARARRQNQSDDSHDGGVNFFEQDVVPNAGGKGFKTVGAPRNAQKRIQELERELESLKARNLRGDDGALAAEAAAGAEALRSSMRAPATQELEVDLRLPEEQAKILRSLNVALRESALRPDGSQSTRQLWQRYTASKKEVTGLINLLPTSAWRVLWDTQYNSKILNEARSQHLWTLADDLVRAGQVLTPVQKMARVEGRLANKSISEGIALWKQERGELGKHAQLAGAFLPLGIKLLVEANELDAAWDLALKIAKEDSAVATSCFIPLIESYLNSSVAANQDKAVNAYFHLRLILGDLITMEDFDRLTLCFLRHGHPDLATGVFKDMVLAECNSAHDSVVRRQKSIKVFDDFQTSTADLAESSNESSLKMLRFLPREFQNKYFYASWLKRLIGLDELDAAQQVLELMAHRAVRPDAKHLNGLMSAWLRRNTPRGRDMALELGHAMIRRRLDLVARRQANPSSDFKQTDLPANASSDMLPYRRDLPPATIETFSVLLLHYVRSNMTSSTTRLLTTLQLAALEPNIFFVNHLLLAHKQGDDAASAWNLFCSSQGNGLRPDAHTFTTLWDTCKNHIENHSPGRSQAFPSPRALFGHMTAWLAGLPSKEKMVARTSMSAETYLQVIRCLTLSRDLRGTLVALYEMRDLFGLYPDARAARLIAMLVAGLGSQRRSQRVRLHDGRVARKRQSVKIRERANQVHFEQALHVLEVLKHERDAELATMGVAPDDLTDSQRGEEVLWLLGAFLRQTLEQVQNAALINSDRETNADISTVEERLQQVAFEMGASVVHVAAPAVGQGT